MIPGTEWLLTRACDKLAHVDYVVDMKPHRASFCWDQSGFLGRKRLNAVSASTVLAAVAFCTIFKRLLGAPPVP